MSACPLTCAVRHSSAFGPLQCRHATRTLLEAGTLAWAIPHITTGATRVRNLWPDPHRAHARARRIPSTRSPERHRTRGADRVAGLGAVRRTTGAGVMVARR